MLNCDRLSIAIVSRPCHLTTREPGPNLSTVSEMDKSDPSTTGVWSTLQDTWTVLLTTYKRDGTGVGTPVNLAVDGDRAYFRTYDKAGKAKRIRNNPIVDIAPSTVRGRARGSSVRAAARLLEGDEDRHAREVIERKHPVFQRSMIPLGHRLARYRTMHYELTLIPEDPGQP